MELENSAMYPEVMAILSKTTNVNYTWSAIIHANGQDIPALKLLNHDVNADYLTNFTDETMVSLSLSPGTFLQDIYPYQELLEITIVKYPIGELDAVMDTDQPFVSERYRATYVDRGNPVVQSDTGFSNSKEGLDLSTIITVEFQLYNKAVEQMRLRNVGGIYRKMTTENVIKSLLTIQSGLIQNVDADRMPKGVDMVMGDNQKIREQIVLPHGMKLTSAPAYIHNECGGVYSAGFNYYYLNDHWYVYPCFDTERNATAGVKLTVLNIPKNKLPEVERSFRVKGSNLTVLATGDVKFIDDSNVRRGNLGNGVRFANADNFMNGTYAQVSGNKAYISRGLNNTEVISTKNDAGMNNVRNSDTHITSNPYAELSKLAFREGSVFGFVWENSDPTLIYPGMPAKVYYIDGDDIKELQGIVLKGTHTTRLRGFGMTEARYKTDTTLSIYVRRTLE